MTIVVKPLTKTNLNEAIEVVERVFPNDALEEENPGRWFRASLDPEGDQGLLKKYGRIYVEYFVARDTQGRAIGTTGLYRLADDPPERVWLGWYGIIPEARGHGFGRELLQWSIDAAKAKQFRRLRLWTTTAPDEAAAQLLYEQVGLRVVEKESGPGEYTTLYREKTISMETTDHQGKTYDVDALKVFAEQLPVVDVPIELLIEKISPGHRYWDDSEGKMFGPSEMLIDWQAAKQNPKWQQHVASIERANLNDPIFVDKHDYSIIDGVHRLTRAVLEKKKTLPVKYFTTLPEEAIVEPS